jgi:HEPN domain-containing protein
VYLEDLCFSAQQAAEKALKALLLVRQGRFPYVHDIGELLRLLAEAGESISDELWKAKRLTDYAVETRYPGLFEPIKEDEYAEAVHLAERCVAWVRGRVSDKPSGAAG